MKKIVLYIAVALILILLIAASLGFRLPGIFAAYNDRSASNADKCTPGPGYSEESWKEHMSHHPDIYKECLS